MALSKKRVSMYIVISSTAQLSCSQNLKLLSVKSSTGNLCFIPHHLHSSLCTVPLALQAIMRNIQAILSTSVIALFYFFSFFFFLNYVVCGGKHSPIAWCASDTISASL